MLLNPKAEHMNKAASIWCQNTVYPRQCDWKAWLKSLYIFTLTTLSDL